MRVVHRLDGSQDFYHMDLKISATLVEGQLALASTTAGDGGFVTDPTTTSLADVAGLVRAASSYNVHGGAAGTLTYSTTQGDVEGLVRVCVNPDAVFEARASGGATTGTILTTYTAASIDTGGTTFTDSDATVSMDEGVVWAIAPNANLGQSRRITGHSGGQFTVTVPFLRDIAVNDAFLAIPWLPFGGAALQLTSDFLEANANIATGTGGNARAIQVILNGPSDSYVQFIARDHALNELS